MKRFLWVLFLGVSFYTTGQQLVLKKGTVIDSVSVSNNSTESFALYLPKNYEAAQQWPVVFVCDMHGQGIKALQNYKSTAEKLGYILVSINNLTDTLSISKNVLIASKVINVVPALFKIDTARLYVAGFASGGRFASILPLLINNVDGVISCGSNIANINALDDKNPFHFIAIVGKGDFNYPNLIQSARALNRLKFPNQLLTFDGGHEWPPIEKFREALQIFSLASMAKGFIPKDSVFIKDKYTKSWQRIYALISAQKMLDAERKLAETKSIFRLLGSVDSLTDKLHWIKKNRIYKTQKRSENTTLSKESYTRDDYRYYLEEDVNTYNLKNLGWWTYQMDELKKYTASSNSIESHMGERLSSFVNALIEENIVTLKKEVPLDEKALRFLWMLKTITAPKEYSYYLKIISNSTKNDDFGTSLFYTEELLKQGYTNKKELYNLKNTAILRITPEFNELVSKYLKDARYAPPK